MSKHWSVEYAADHFGSLGVRTHRSSPLERLPLYHEADFRSIKFWFKLISKSAPELAYQMDSEMMKTNKPQIWNNKLKTIIEQLGYGYLWIEQVCTNPYKFQGPRSNFEIEGGGGGEGTASNSISGGAQDIFS